MQQIDLDITGILPIAVAGLTGYRNVHPSGRTHVGISEAIDAHSRDVQRDTLEIARQTLTDECDRDGSRSRRGGRP
jgi:hypothetical protein